MKTSVQPEAYPRILTLLLEGITLFVSVWVLLSVWGGYTVGISWITPLVALVATIGWMKHFHAGGSSGKWTKEVLGLAGIALLILLGSGHIFFGTQHGFDLSADAAPSIAAQFIGEKIPLTYQPYFDLPFIYQLGLPVLVSQLPSSVPPYVWSWCLSVISILLFVFWAGRWAFHFTGKHSSILWVGILILGLRLPFLNLLVGEYPWLFALGMGLGIVWMARHSILAGGIGFAALATIHPYVGFNFFLFWILLTRPNWISFLQTTLLAFLGFLPVLYYQVLPALGGGGTRAAVLPSWNTLTAIPSLAGLIPFVLFLGIVIHGFVVKTEEDPWISRMKLLFVVGIAGYLIGSIVPSLSLASKLLEIASLGAVLGGTIWLSVHVKEKHARLIMGGLLILCLVVLVSSNDMQRLANGSKSTLREAEFAHEFGMAFPPVERTLFLAHGANKMAQFSKKIPLSPKGAHFVSLPILQNTHNEAVQEILFYEEEITRVMDTNCTNCLDAFPVVYIVIDAHVFPPLENREPLLQKDDFYVYAGPAFSN